MSWKNRNPKSENRTLLKIAGMVASVLAIGAAIMSCPQPAQAANGNYGGVIDMTQTGSVSNATAVATNNATFALPTDGQGIGIWVNASAANTGNSNLTVTLDLTDGTYWSTTNNLVMSMTLNNTTNVTQFFYFSSTNFWGASGARTGKLITTQTNLVTVKADWAVFPR